MNTPILVTGTHRSGTTWVGKIISKANGVGYIHEPFNIDHIPPVLSQPVEYWYYYIESNSTKYLKPYQNLLDFKYNPFSKFKYLKSNRDFLRLGKDYINISLNKLSKSRPLVKDPLALFSTEWLYHNFNMEVIVLLRHPAAFVNSLKRVSWEFPFQHLLFQEKLMSNELKAFESEIKYYSNNKQDLISQGCLLYNILYSYIYKLKSQYPNWIFVKHEDLSLEPIDGFKEIFSKLKLDFTPQVEEWVNKYSLSKAPKNLTKNQVNYFFRNSRENVKSWKKKLKIEEINSIRKQTEKVAGLFYTDEDW